MVQEISIKENSTDEEVGIITLDSTNVTFNLV